MKRLVLVAFVLLVVCGHGRGAERSFTFAHITDTHVTPRSHQEPLRQFCAGLAAKRIAFVVNTGDVTELGTEEEFAAYREAIGGCTVPIIACPGNHDVRWAPTGKEAFEKACGPRYRSFAYGGCHFVVLDSSIVLEHWGQFDGDQLSWLRRELRRVGRKTPVFVFFHHWLGRERTNIGNASDLLNTLEPYNVVAMFMGHGHSDLEWNVNGTACFMARGLYQGSYHEVAVDGITARVYRVTTNGSQDRRLLAELPLKRQRVKQLKVVMANANGSKGHRVSFRAAFLEDGRVATGAKLTWRIDNGREAELASAQHDGWQRHEFEIDGLVPGWHILALTATLPGRGTWIKEVPFRAAGSGDIVAEVWTYPTASSIQGSPILADGVLYVGTLGGTVYALDARSGSLIWSRKLGGAIHATPTATEEVLIVGASDGRLYALERASGRVRWTYACGSPIFAPAAVCGSTVCIGMNRALCGVSLLTGAELWRVNAGSFFQARPAVARGRFYVGGWDNTFYCVDAASGRVVWSQKMGRTQGGRGALSFYYSPAITSPAVSADAVFVCTNDGVLHALDLDTGEERWAARAPAGGDTFGYSSPLYHDGRLYVGGLGEKGQGDCYCLDAATGQLVWRCSTGADNYDSSPVLAGEFVAIGSVAGRVTWMDRQTAERRAAYQPPPGYSFASPVSDGERTYTCGLNGHVVSVSNPGNGGATGKR